MVMELIMLLLIFYIIKLLVIYQNLEWICTKKLIL